MNSEAIDGLPYRESSRLSGWDYSKAGWYFVTICTQDRYPFFGEIQHKIIGLSPTGSIVWEVWRQLPQQFNMVLIDMFVVMPNHVHGIIRILDRGITLDDFKKADAVNRVQTGQHGNSGGVTGQKNPMATQRHLGRIIQWFKGRCTYEIHQQEGIRMAIEVL
ncbi:MAG: hypothetical protein K9N46_06075 [Candidatus Marinimicrobia bacterium]|nr:hypothetical protein [Candidatus Neomarinimicrobiota bacterium]MCF7880286.1 hypothetical protein [Candidatus Neomarinimicrobiota bacterium]